MGEKVRVSCNDCGEVLTLDYHSLGDGKSTLDPCPQCGSTHRMFDKTLSTEVQAYTSLRAVAKRPGVKHAIVEFISGIVSSARYGFVKKYQRIDRIGNRYQEHVETLDGTVVHDVAEDLDKHWGHGSAKFEGVQHHQTKRQK